MAFSQSEKLSGSPAVFLATRYPVAIISASSESFGITFFINQAVPLCGTNLPRRKIIFLLAVSEPHSTDKSWRENSFFKFSIKTPLGMKTQFSLGIPTLTASSMVKFPTIKSLSSFLREGMLIAL